MPVPVPDRADRRCDVLVVGAGAAGLMAALAARGAVAPDGGRREVGPGAPDVVLLNNERRLGLKLLVSGGGRCNLTHARVDEGDYQTGAPHVLRGLLRAFPVASARAFFERRGCPLYEEPLGKVFPTSDDARQVLAVLLEAVERAGAPLVAPAEVVDLAPPGGPDDDRWRAALADGSAWRARRVVLATGGLSLPRTGSRGFGLDALARLGHTVEAPAPALTPLLLGDDGPLHGLAGLTAPLVLTLAPRAASPEQLAGARFRPLARSAGSLLVTHRGASGPAALDVSGPCARALARGEDVVLRADAWSLHQPDGPWAPFLGLPKPPGACLPGDAAPRPPAREAFLTQAAPLLADRARGLGNALAERLPRSLVQGLLRAVGVDPAQPLRQVDARGWGRVHVALTQADLRVTGVDGYQKAEVTAGGVLLQELERTTLESRRHPGLFCCGEVVDVTGRLGGFNFQWAWASGFAAGAGAAASLARE
ncbi:MAG: NAD(P)/FAD-dependent oxidoreductase [Planctomycetes bacterium]|nr:NAD(P)/FAD-dependent oxidoreductase [Planctomycetota bacterium]